MYSNFRRKVRFNSGRFVSRFFHFRDSYPRILAYRFPRIARSLRLGGILSNLLKNPEDPSFRGAKRRGISLFLHSCGKRDSSLRSE